VSGAVDHIAMRIICGNFFGFTKRLSGVYQLNVPIFTGDDVRIGKRRRRIRWSGSVQQMSL